MRQGPKSFSRARTHGTRKSTHNFSTNNTLPRGSHYLCDEVPDSRCSEQEVTSSYGWESHSRGWRSRY